MTVDLSPFKDYLSCNNLVGDYLTRDIVYLMAKGNPPVYNSNYELCEFREEDYTEVISVFRYGELFYRTHWTDNSYSDKDNSYEAINNLKIVQPRAIQTVIYE